MVTEEEDREREKPGMERNLFSVSVKFRSKQNDLCW